MNFAGFFARFFAVLAVVAFAGVATAQDHPGRGSGDHPRRSDQSQQTDNAQGNDAAPPNAPLCPPKMLPSPAAVRSLVRGGNVAVCNEVGESPSC